MESNGEKVQDKKKQKKPIDNSFKCNDTTFKTKGCYFIYVNHGHHAT